MSKTKQSGIYFSAELLRQLKANTPYSAILEAARMRRRQNRAWLRELRKLQTTAK
jgi:hypothetical protein